MDKVFVIKGVADKLWATEDAIDGALADASKLLGGIVDAGRELRIAHGTTDAAMNKVAEAIRTLAEARASVVEAHHELNEVKLRLGVRTKLDGMRPSVEEDHVAARRVVVDRQAS